MIQVVTAQKLAHFSKIRKTYVIEDALLPVFLYLMEKLVWYSEKNINAHH